jgi:preprotein translocase subunit SecE
MATEDDNKADEAGDTPPHPTEDETERANELIAPKDGVVAVVHDAPGDGALDSVEDEGNAPAQLGHTRYVYAAYMAGAIAVAFLLSKIGEYAWHGLSQKWLPTIGEPKGEIIIPISGLLGALIAVYYFRDQKTRELAEDVASELSKVTWPNKEEVMNSTAVVIFTTVFSTIFFALMDRFWGFLTNLVYGT